MKCVKILCAVAMVLSVASFMVFPATAQQTKDAAKDKSGSKATVREVSVRIKAAIINIDAIRRNAEVVKDIRRQISELRKSYQADIKKEEEELRNANQELARQRSILSPEAFAEERRKFEQRLAKVQRLVQNRRQDLEQIKGTALRKVEVALQRIVTDVSKREKLTLVFRSDQLVFWVKSLEITGIVLSELNKVMPTLKIQEQPATK